LVFSKPIRWGQWLFRNELEKTNPTTLANIAPVRWPDRTRGEPRR
jgi:hypothetical protein